MPTTDMRGVIQHLRSMVVKGRAGLAEELLGFTDDQLLENFVSHPDHGMMAALMARHGPMVWGVCRRILRHYQDAEDAFQATFLVFVRKATSIAPRSAVATWLYSVAHKTAWRAKVMADKRKLRERPVAELPEAPVVQHESSEDLQALLDEELIRLPEHFRRVIVLCDLEGQTLKEAAIQLGVSEWAVAKRLARARQKLALRLARHGVATSSGALAALLAQQVAAARMPMALMVSTLQAAGLFAAGEEVSELLSPQVIELTQGVLHGMSLSKLKALVLGFIVLAACACLLVATGQTSGHASKQCETAGESTWRRQTALRTSLVHAQVQPANDQDTGGIDPKIIEAWKKAGARFVWLWENGDFADFNADRPKGEKALPGFCIGAMELPPKQPLPIPKVPFGLVVFEHPNSGFLAHLPGRAQAQMLFLTRVELSEADLKELASLKQLQTLWLSFDLKTSDEDLMVLAGLKQLKALHIQGSRITDVGMKALAGLEQLQDLVLGGEKITDEGLNALAKLQQLQKLRLYGPQITDVGMKALAAFKQLNYLRIRGTRLSNAGLKELAGLKQLQSLDLSGTLVSDEGLKQLGGLEQLQSLELSETQISDMGLKHLAGLKQLRELTLRGTQVSNAGLKALAGLEKLQSLNLSETQISDAGLKALADVKQLRSLTLNNTQISDAGLRALADVMQLQSLWLTNTQITDAGLKALGELKQLKSLCLDNTQISDTGLKALADLKHLQKLELNNTQVSDPGLKTLAGLKQLQQLWLTNTQISDAGLKALADLKQLELLTLEQTRVTDTGLQALAGMKLKWLALPKQAQTDVGLKNLVAAAPMCRWLNLNNWQITDMGVSELAGLKYLHSVELGETQITDAGLELLAGLKQLQEINVAKTQVTDAGVAALKKSLPWLRIER